MAATLGLEELQYESQATTDSIKQSSPVLGKSSPIPSNTDGVTPHSHGKSPCHAIAPIHCEASSQEVDVTVQQQAIDRSPEVCDASQDTTPKVMIINKRNFEDFNNEGDDARASISEGVNPEEITSGDDRYLFDSQGSTISGHAWETRRAASESMLQSSKPTVWDGLLSTTNNHSHLEAELGED